MVMGRHFCHFVLKRKPYCCKAVLLFKHLRRELPLGTVNTVSRCQLIFSVTIQPFSSQHLLIGCSICLTLPATGNTEKLQRLWGDYKVHSPQKTTFLTACLKSARGFPTSDKPSRNRESNQTCHIFRFVDTFQHFVLTLRQKEVKKGHLENEETTIRSCQPQFCCWKARME